MFLPKWVRECVAFIGAKPHGKFQPNGTAFFVAAKGTETEAPSLYVVTAAHVVFGSGGRSAPGRMWVRANYGAASEEVLIEAGEWRKHPTADVAVAEWTDPQGRESTRVDLEELANKEIIDYYSMGLGHDLYMVGLFQRHTGSKTNEVMCRRGSIAMMPSEPVTIDRHGNTADVYLMEVRSIGGFSGSPVFVHVPEYTVSGPNRPANVNSSDFYLLGLASGHWDIPMLRKDSGKHQPPPKERNIATGISTVVPAAKILETISQGVFVEARKARKRLELTENAPSEDSLESSRGPQPERLKLSGPFEDRIRESFKAQKPPKRAKR
jgi:hypothetical protein